MAHSFPRRDKCREFKKRVVLVVGLFLIGFCVWTPVYWHLKRDLTHKVLCSCAPCDCTLQLDLPAPLSTLISDTFKDCGKHDPELKEEMEKDNEDLVAEELHLHETVASETLEHTRALIKVAMTTSSQFQREAERCNARMETCEEARERAERLLAEERKLSDLWEKRAQDLGWIQDGNFYT
ncbi:uncharacterized protein LOC123209437 [Mangifera indica]|uniref:uncharacterized protein LOC123209437 n=1 Tax=Mangifera indica TaxID=29780 RepID=UPI001CFA4308|nr:uncharacterized protein LOC123209437 [Mangifera indica]